jgi:hypothetical protein
MDSSINFYVYLSLSLSLSVVQHDVIHHSAYQPELLKSRTVSTISFSGKDSTRWSLSPPVMNGQMALAVPRQQMYLKLQTPLENRTRTYCTVQFEGRIRVTGGPHAAHIPRGNDHQSSFHFCLIRCIHINTSQGLYPSAQADT